MAVNGSIAGKVFLDANGNNVPDAGEAGLAGIKVTLKTAGATDVIATTDSTGAYNFGSLAAGTYSVTAATPTGKVPDSATPVSVSVADQAVTGQNLGFYDPASVNGFVFLDANGNGTMDSKEAAIDGVTVNLLDSTGHLVASKVSAPNQYFPHGVYQFDGVRPGTYTVQAIFGGGQTRSTGALGGGQALNAFNEGIANLSGTTGTIFGYAVKDGNGNGTLDYGEALVNGVTVELLNAGGTRVATTTTGPGAPLASLSALDGSYAFAGVAPGSYSVRFTAPSGTWPAP